MSDAAAAVVTLRHVAAGYGRSLVLRDVSLDIRAGEVWFFLGPNGSGKTTLLRVVLGVLAPRSGTVERNPAFASHAHVGFVPQRCDLNASLPTTVRELVALGLVGADAGGEKPERRVAWALDRVGLRGMERQSYRALSGGQRQRVLLARALVRRPRLLVADEPTTGLDPVSKRALLATLHELHREEALTILFVTHELDVAAASASHVALFARRVESAADPASGDPLDPAEVLVGPRDAVLTGANLDRTFGAGAAALIPPLLLATGAERGR